LIVLSISTGREVRFLANSDVDLKRFLEVVTAQQQDTDVGLDAIKDDD
jgi:hypothetical protein